MKTLILLVFTILAATTFISCKKTYTCTCQSAWTKEWYDEPIEAGSKRKANRECLKKVAPEVDGPLQCYMQK